MTRPQKSVKLKLSKFKLSLEKQQVFIRLEHTINYQFQQVLYWSTYSRRLIETAKSSVHKSNDNSKT
jgi:hypothetical protein